MIVELPTNLNRITMYQFLNKVINNDKLPMDDKIILDMRSLRFIEPVGVTVLSNVIRWLKKNGVVTVYRLPGNRKFPNAVEYLDNSFFFKEFIGRTLADNAQPLPTTLPLNLIAYQKSHQWLENVFLPWLSLKLDTSVQSLVNIKVCFEEIFNNINDHSTEEIGCIFVQQYPKLNTVNVAISDFGVGIPAKIQEFHPSFHDADALSKAVIHGFTTRSIPRNSGAGLHTLVNNVVNNNKGNVYLHSNHGILECTHKNNELWLRGRNIGGFYPGTLINIEFRTDTIENLLDTEEEFTWF